MTRIGIVGYGNLAKGVECSISQNADMELVAVFTRRDPASIEIRTEGVNVYSIDDINDWKDKVDLLILCGGSATDLPEMSPELAKNFNIIDSYDNHSCIPNHYDMVNKSATENNKLAFISIGWDPGMFSVNRIYAESILPVGNDYTFWGRGVSQGHGDAVRRIEGVIDARQYTIPVPAALEKVRAGENPTLTTREKHTRYCYVVAEEGADQDRIREEIVTMPAYFEPYDTTVEFISAEEMQKNHSGIPHGGSVIRSGKTGFNNDINHTIEYKLTLDSNPHFTASVLVSCARALTKMAARGEVGCKTIFDIAPADLSPRTREDLMTNML